MAFLFEKYLFHSICVIKTATYRGLKFPRAFQFLQLLVLQRVYGIDFHISFRRTNKVHEQIEVFLGGSCNPTTWRYEHAIPYFQSQSITFYNPQVSQWTPDLIDIEHHAKESASLLFFVIDSNTRALASIAEVCYLTARGRNILVVMNCLPNDRSQIKFLQDKSSSNTIDDQHDYENVYQAREMLRLFIQKENLLILDNLHLALECAAFLIHRKMTILDLHARNDSCLTHDDGYGDSMDESISRQSTIESDTFDDQPALQVLSNICLSSYHFIYNFFTSVMNSSDSYLYDVYIACGSEDEHWLEMNVYPIFNELNINYLKHENSLDNDLIDIRIGKQSRYLFYLINDNERLSNLVTELAYMIGERRHEIIVYFRSKIRENSTEILTKHERIDIERSRKYVEDLARKENIIFYQTREESCQQLLSFFL